MLTITPMRLTIGMRWAAISWVVVANVAVVAVGADGDGVAVVGAEMAAVAGDGHDRC